MNSCLFESVRYIFKQACDVTTNLVDWFPSIFRDTTRILTEKDLSKIAQGIGSSWKLLGYELGLTKVQMEHISENEGSMVMKILGMLWQWREADPFAATVGRLHEAMKNCSKVTIDWTVIGRVFAGI
ncbi:uncharacterized protein LOC128553944 [Mercenaria mercenaria]|uniref:uncharacterized protein LOC128553944 n=1 Tax=Mercenaria mercenaria TaxID=6596 RepID=UPI00234F5F54|nr:uncharacterized protein LOC128553944 [Mercenaria mercenaria]XP_053391120.1 uncharacterized protein LOC128553944 [Mercenaria mercenaria]